MTVTDIDPSVDITSFNTALDNPVTLKQSDSGKLHLHRGCCRKTRTRDVQRAANTVERTELCGHCFSRPNQYTNHTLTLLSPALAELAWRHLTFNTTDISTVTGVDYCKRIIKLAATARNELSEHAHSSDIVDDVDARLLKVIEQLETLCGGSDDTEIITYATRLRFDDFDNDVTDGIELWRAHIDLALVNLTRFGRNLEHAFDAALEEYVRTRGVTLGCADMVAAHITPAVRTMFDNDLASRPRLYVVIQHADCDEADALAKLSRHIVTVEHFDDNSGDLSLFAAGPSRLCGRFLDTSPNMHRSARNFATVDLANIETAEVVNIAAHLHTTGYSDAATIAHTATELAAIS